MATDQWEHPRLAAEAEGRLRLTEDEAVILDQPETASPEAQPATTPEAQQAPEKRGFYIDSDDMYGSLRRLADENPSLRNVLKSFTGRSNQAESKQRIAELEAELHNFRLMTARSRIEAVPETEHESAYLSDPTFKEAFDLVAEAEPVDVNAVREDMEWNNAIDRAFQAVEHLLPEWRADQYKAALDEGGCQNCAFIKEPHGVFDHDDRGNPLSRLEALDALRVRLASEASQYAEKAKAENPLGAKFDGSSAATSSVETAVAQATKPREVTPSSVAEAVAASRQVRGNPNLGEARPDMQPASGAAVGVAPITFAQYEKMPWEERFRRWPNPGDYERAIERGEVLIEGLNT